jgi:hypothetical protein
MGTGTKKNESSIGRVWAAGFRHVRPRSGLGRFENYEPIISLILLVFTSRGKQLILNLLTLYQRIRSMTVFVTAVCLRNLYP